MIIRALVFFQSQLIGLVLKQRRLKLQRLRQLIRVDSLQKHRIRGHLLEYVFLQVRGKVTAVLGLIRHASQGIIRGLEAQVQGRPRTAARAQLERTARVGPRSRIGTGSLHRQFLAPLEEQFREGLLLRSRRRLRREKVFGIGVPPHLLRGLGGRLQRRCRNDERGQLDVQVRFLVTRSARQHLRRERPHSAARFA